jgi:transcriptional regulator with XRE-family HTH domain
MNLGERLKYLREKAGYTQGFLADFLNLKVKASISSYEKGTSEPTITSIIKLAELYKADVRWLLTGEGGPKEYLIKEPEIEYHIRPKEYRVVASVPAGIGEMQDYYEDYFESHDLNYDPADHLFMKVDKELGFSMMPIVNPGDLVLISLSAKIHNNDLVVAKWNERRGALKIITFDENDQNNIVLTSYNQSVPPMFVKRDKIHVYKVVLIKKKE